MPSLQIFVPEGNPLIKRLEDRAIRRGLADRKKPAVLRRRLPALARTLLDEKLSDLKERGDSKELQRESAREAATS